MINRLCGAVLLLLAGQALAATTWTLTTTVSPGVTVSGVANTGGTDTSNNGANQTIQNATIVSYPGGVGIRNADWASGDVDVNESSSPEHAIDNNERFDMVLLNFGAQKVNLTGLSLGWVNTDSDISVMAYTGANPMSLIGNTYGSLVGLGWKVIGNYSDEGVGTVNITGSNGQTLLANQSSSYWLIGAYNWVAAGGNFTQNTTAGYMDYVKLASVTGDVKTTITQVPEPGSFALITLALVGMLYMRQRRSAGISA